MKRNEQKGQVHSIRLKDEIWRHLNKFRDDLDLNWDDYIEFLLKTAEGADLMAAQLDSQAARIGWTRGQLIRGIASFLSFEELHFLRLDQSIWDDIRAVAEEFNEPNFEAVKRMIREFRKGDRE